MAASRTESDRQRPVQLLEGCPAAGASASGDSIARHGERLFAFIARMTGDENPAGDIFRRVFVKTVEDAASRGGGMSFLVRLYRIAVDAVADELRRSRRSAVPAGPGIDGPRRTEEAIRTSLAELPFEQRAAFLLKEEAELTFDDIGAVLGCGREAAKGRFLLAAGRLRSALGMGGGA